MSACEQFRPKIEEILRGSDLNAITTKFVRRSLEHQIGYSLDPIKKEINAFIETIFIDFQQEQEERTKQYLALLVKKEEQQDKKLPSPPTKAEAATIATVKKEKGNKVEKKSTAAAPKKKAAAKKEPGATKRVVNWPVYKIKSPLKEVIHSELCTRPATVKKLWEYIKGNELQDPVNKSIIRCDEKFKALCDGQDTCTAFNMNKYISKYFENIDKDDQPYYKQLYAKQEAEKNPPAT